jgi:large subunit ribosomal protein L30
MIKIKQVHSACGGVPNHRETVRCLGFTKVNQVRLVPDTPAMRGMVKSVCHLVKIVEEGAKS